MNANVVGDVDLVSWLSDGDTNNTELSWDIVTQKTLQYHHWFWGHCFILFMALFHCKIYILVVLLWQCQSMQSLKVVSVDDEVEVFETDQDLVSFAFQPGVIRFWNWHNEINENPKIMSPFYVVIEQNITILQPKVTHPSLTCENIYKDTFQVDCGPECIALRWIQPLWC